MEKPKKNTLKKGLLIPNYYYLLLISTRYSGKTMKHKVACNQLFLKATNHYGSTGIVAKIPEYNCIWLDWKTSPT